MKKKLFILLLAGVVTLFSGCGLTFSVSDYDIITEFAFSVSEPMLLIDDCINSRITSCTTERNSIKIEYENGTSVYNYIDMNRSTDTMQKVIIKGDCEFLDENLSTLLKILLYADEREKEYNEMLNSVKETGKGTIALKTVTCTVVYEEGCLTVTSE